MQQKAALRLWVFGLKKGAGCDKERLEESYPRAGDGGCLPGGGRPGRERPVHGRNRLHHPPMLAITWLPAGVGCARTVWFARYPPPALTRALWGRVSQSARVRYELGLEVRSCVRIRSWSGTTGASSSGACSDSPSASWPASSPDPARIPPLPVGPALREDHRAAQFPHLAPGQTTSPRPPNIVRSPGVPPDALTSSSRQVGHTS